jgi:hypothetical protein
MFGVDAKLLSREEQIQITSEFMINIFPPFSEETEKLTHSAQSKVLVMSFATFFRERCLLFRFQDSPELLDRLRMYLMSLSECIVMVMKQIAGQSKKLSDFLFIFLYANPFTESEHRYFVLNFLVQAVCDWKSSLFPDMSILLDFCCDRIIDGSFRDDPFSIYQTILGKYQQLQQTVSAKFVIALAVSICRNCKWQFLQLLSHYANQFKTRIDFEFGVCLLNYLTVFWGDPSRHSQAISIFKFIQRVMKTFLEGDKIAQWMNTVNGNDPLSLPSMIPVTEALDVVRQHHITTKSKILAEAAENNPLKELVEQSCIDFCTAMQQNSMRWNLEIQGLKQMFHSAIGFDLSIYSRVREKSNLFAAFIGFSEACAPSEEMRKRAFHCVFNVTDKDAAFKVKVEIAKFPGNCLMIKKREQLLLVDQCDEEFNVRPNSRAFCIIFNTAFVDCYSFEGLLVLPLDVKALRVDVSGPQPTIFASLTGGFGIAIRAATPDSPRFLDIVAQLSEGRNVPDVRLQPRRKGSKS